MMCGNSIDHIVVGGPIDKCGKLERGLYASSYTFFGRISDSHFFEFVICLFQHRDMIQTVDGVIATPGNVRDLLIGDDVPGKMVSISATSGSNQVGFCSL